ncbi:outer membrane beta-barrel protein [Flavobacterium difficile]|uniref:Porin n=1 Tax=Flavobacterium difficile TaxID=2709659 RepID=A0ABX0I2W5_9FLAO|nr:outer membrane beta-barrel protein [Flavobacterium difficile]NHM01521.1 porin [Flavobacterium difficile]
MKKIILLVSIFIGLATNAQDSISKVKIDVSGFIDTYYSYDFDQPESKFKQNFLYNYNRQNSFNVNIALIRATINYENVYAKISAHAGTYVEDNYASESIKYLNEAYLGVFLNKSQTTTLEAGILPSYIGFESAITHANLTATRSILAENSPYYMTGVKLNHQFNEKWSLAGLITNGWQHIEKPKSDIAPSFGTQLVYKPNNKNTLNWSTFLGKEAYAGNFNMRYFSNFYWDATWNSKWRSIFGIDYGIQDISSKNNEKATWWSPILITQYTINSKWQMAYRIEYYQDRKNAIISSLFPFETIGNSINFDFLPNSKFKIRTEGKWYHATENNFDLGSKNNNYSITTTMSFEF